MDIESSGTYFSYHYLIVEDELREDEIDVPEDFDNEINVPYLRGRYRCCHALVDRKLRPDPSKIVQMFDEKLFKQISYVPSGEPAPEWAQHDCRSQILNFVETKLRKRRRSYEEDDKFFFFVVFGAFIVGEQEEDVDRKFIPASKDAIGGLEKVSGLGRDEECVICLGGNEKENSLALKIPCGHVYHQDCIVEWLRKSHLCPLCRYALPVDSW